jgi:hypothetical protein
MRLVIAFSVMVLLYGVASASDYTTRPYQIRDDFAMDPLSDCLLQYYYYIPCPSYSWIWEISGLATGDMVGAWFEIGDMSMGAYAPCDPADCHILESFRVLNYAGYGTPSAYPSFIAYQIFCCDHEGSPLGPPLWDSGVLEQRGGPGYVIDVDPPISICNCVDDPGPPPQAPRILITATNHCYPWTDYPYWGLDNISYAVERGCGMHDIGCSPAFYPRPYTGHYPIMHSGFYGQDFEYCPPLWFKDLNDSTPDGTLYGYIELFWRIYVACTGPTSATPTTWGAVKSLYR